jgi:7,8-dihydropterin-6-yl-methyl-4-(beta-D-ribofuranosyl)aminobenzene 5'-phosphate synthase
MRAGLTAAVAGMPLPLGAAVLAFVLLACCQPKGESAASAESPAEQSRLSQAPAPDHPPENAMLKITTLYDNYPKVEGLETAWGFACLVEFDDTVVMFDTGGDPAVLAHNLDALKVDLSPVQALVLSHDHGDHTGGLSEALRRRPGLKVYVCRSFSQHTKNLISDGGGELSLVSEPVEIAPGFWSTGELGGAIPEQSLVVLTPAGSVVITGCAHPGIVNIVRRAKELAPGGVELVLGGFHLGGAPEATVKRIIDQLKELGVHRLSPSHCTGDAAIAQFRRAFGEDYIPGGVGTVFEL